ncbi:MAG: GAF domain-containing protein, partial [Anaerolineae bacterium]|nr:GAF domain-containing protein [Anaerolineae bacterium]
MPDAADLLKILSSISSSFAIDEILADFTEKTVEFMGVDSCTISEWDTRNDTLIVLAEFIAPDVPRPADDVDSLGAAYPLAYYPATAQAISGQTPLIIYVDDPDADEAERELLQSLRWAGVLVIPMIYKGRVVGLMELYTMDKQVRRFTDPDLVFGQAIAGQAALALENVRLYEAAEEGRLQAEMMRVISRALASELDYNRIMYDLVNFALHLVQAHFVAIIGPDLNRYRTVAYAGHERGMRIINRVLNFAAYPQYEQLLGRAAQAPVIIPDTATDPTLAYCQEEFAGLGWRTMVAVPLLSHQTVIGILNAYATQPNFFNPNDVAALLSLASQAVVAVQNAKLFEALETKRQQLHQVSVRLVNAQEEERRRISRELHDELGQSLTALKINLDVGQRILPADSSPQLKNSLAEAASLAKQTL